MEYIKVILLGIIEGITEFLPISSTGHLILAEQFIQLEPKSFSNAFMIIIQLGAILSVVVISFHKLNPFQAKDLPEHLAERYDRMNLQSRLFYRLRYPDRQTMKLWSKIIVAVLPAMILGLLFDDLIDEYLFNPTTVSIMLIFWGVVIILVERGRKKEPSIYGFEGISYRTALLIGCFQCLAMIPGTSRSAATIIGALLLGCDRILATEFSFYLAIPTMLGATFLKIVKNLGSYTSHQWLLILLGFIVAFLVAFVAVKKFLDYIKKRDFQLFGYYRIVVGVLVLISMIL
ncbi:MAG: undecaprenyl-diphosphate phosphatase [Tissierellia bacterium]|nr:undecaprenyl-diphosphate phosphatase [Tissierellia bacterium]